jgi:hypothetical protein
MNNLWYIFLLSVIPSVKLNYIKNQNKPICSNCKFFIANKNECGNFGDINIISGKYTYENAISVRNNEDKCGQDAIFFKKNNFKFITVPYYFAKDNTLLVILLAVIIYDVCLIFLSF